MRYAVRHEVRRKARVSIGVPTYNCAQRAGWLLQTLQRTTPRDDVALTLLDDGSRKSNQREMLVALAQQWDANCLTHHKNEGVTASWNDLVRFVDAEYCVLLNDDIFLTDRWLENLVYFLEHNECGGAAPNALFCARDDVPALLNGESVVPRDPRTKARHPERAEQDLDEAPGPTLFALGCCWGFRRAVYDALSGFDERATQIFNDVWFGAKAARDLKLPSFQIPAPRIWHLWAQTFSENPGLHGTLPHDRAEYEREFGGGIEASRLKFMTMPPRVVKWIGPDGQPREKELEIR